MLYYLKGLFEFESETEMKETLGWGERVREYALPFDNRCFWSSEFNLAGHRGTGRFYLNITHWQRYPTHCGEKIVFQKQIFHSFTYLGEMYICFAGNEVYSNSWANEITDTLLKNQEGIRNVSSLHWLKSSSFLRVLHSCNICHSKTSERHNGEWKICARHPGL